MTSDSPKPKVVGIYGLPGTGKTRLLKQLETSLGPSRFLYFEGSQVIHKIVPGGLEIFKKTNDVEKYRYRCEAANHIKETCVENNKIGIVTGHFIFWEDETLNEPPQNVLTDTDYNTYGFVIYLHANPGVIAQRRRDDSGRCRPSLPVDHIEKWQDKEVKMLKEKCRKHGILFIMIAADQPLATAIKLIEDVHQHDETVNFDRAKRAINEAGKNYGEELETMLVLDADGTLSEDDASSLFWREAGISNPLKEMFKSPLKYSYEAFRQATLMIEEVADEQRFEEICERTASKVRIHEEMRVLLARATTTPYTGAVVLSAGIKRVWEKILHNISPKIHVIGGGRISDGFVVSGDVKAGLVHYLRDTLNLYVVAFGDSPLDLNMLKAANMAVVVVSPKNPWSRAMEQQLLQATIGGFDPKQVLLPSDNKEFKLKCPTIMLTDQNFLDDIFCRRVRVIVAPDHIAKIMMTPTRDASISGPALRDAHQKIGRYLTIDLVSQILGLEKFDIPHVQGKMTDGYKIAGERSTTIIALMRGGESMAFGVAEQMPKAMFVHAYSLEQIKAHHLDGQSTIFLVDSVINTGKSIIDFIKGLRKRSSAPIVVVAGVIHQDAVREKGSKRALLATALRDVEDVIILALRVSNNQHKGSGGNDTGNRLFNTPQIL